MLAHYSQYLIWSAQKPMQHALSSLIYVHKVTENQIG